MADTAAAPISTPNVVRRYFWQRRRFWIVFASLVVAGVVAFVAMLPSTRALMQFQRIRQGMTEQDVVALLGPPTNANEYATSHPILGNQFRGWVVGELAFFVHLQDGVVVNKSVHTHLSIARRLFPNYFSRNLL